MEKQLRSISKLMSLVLRHQPEHIGITLDENGWASVSDLLEKMNRHGINVNMFIIEKVVETNDKKRFAFNENKTMIRASQGHSIDVDLQLSPVKPPDVLYHGTVAGFVESILRQGLQKQNRQHVHLSENIDTACSVGARRGKPIILKVNAKAMHEQGIQFFISENNVWLVDEVPVAFISD